jgi:hypothetical protein
VFTQRGGSVELSVGLAHIEIMGGKLSYLSCIMRSHGGLGIDVVMKSHWSGRFPLGKKGFGLGLKQFGPVHDEYIGMRERYTN